MKEEKTYDKKHSIRLKYSQLPKVQLILHNGRDYAKFNL